MSDPSNETQKKLDNACLFMKLPKCMRQDTGRQLDLNICTACILGRIEGHLYALREHYMPKELRRN